MNFADRFLKCGNYHKPQFYEQILKLQKLILLENFFLFSPQTHVNLQLL
ncbi:hypothetical protein LEP1GSC172_0349 [Leptospira noguchii]|uniref:Uncharacterized protein n=1 Tax=Leptospira noguchii TaxID=28182 RepID=M6V529_9LEPT|nr:hypothetical protein LEP1GSC172_0349 [Leptospira noguchii]